MSALVDWDIHFGEDRHVQSRSVEVACRNLSFWYGEKQSLIDVNLDFHAREVTALIGPSGCGKTTLIRCLNRMNDLIPDTRMEGSIVIEGMDIVTDFDDQSDLRKMFGWVAQKPNPFPDSVYDNVAYGPRIHGLVDSPDHERAIVEDALQEAGLWDEMKHRLDESGTELSGGQQQRLCIARAIAMKPNVVLMDEPCSALDPHSTTHVEELIAELKQRYTIIIITHNMQQAARVSQRAAFMHLGRMLEVNDTMEIFTNPQNELCRDYIHGQFG